MGIEAFPDIENFNKLPRQVVVKGAVDDAPGAEGLLLHGIVLNNTGHTICDLKVNVVIFDENKIPVLNTSVVPEQVVMAQGAVSAFSFNLKGKVAAIKDYHLYTNWKFNDRE